MGYWDRLCDIVGNCSQYSIVANKTRLVFTVRVRFACVSAVSDRGMSFAFWLKRRVDSARFRRVDHYGGNDWGYNVRVTTMLQLRRPDPTFAVHGLRGRLPTSMWQDDRAGSGQQRFPGNPPLSNLSAFLATAFRVLSALRADDGGKTATGRAS